MQACINGSIPSSLAPLLCAARLIPLRKKDEGVRPVAVGDVLRRIVGKCLLHHPTVAEQVRTLQPLQLGVGVSMACPTVAHALQRAVAELPCDGNWAVLQVDVANAFNTVLRPAILQGARDLAPAVVPWLQFCHWQTVPLYTGTLAIPSAVGTHQGCPLGPLGCALGVHAALHPRCRFAQRQERLRCTGLPFTLMMDISLVP